MSRSGVKVMNIQGFRVEQSDVIPAGDYALQEWYCADAGCDCRRVLAKMFGRSLKSVRARRGKKRIRVKKDWRPEDDSFLQSALRNLEAQRTGAPRQIRRRGSRAARGIH